jgi:phosphohistidine phosphatase
VKKLIILRHAKTEAHAVDDRRRQLTDRGRQQARSVGPAIAELGLRNLVVYVSTALRTMQTWEEIVPAMDPGVDVRPTDELYAFDEDDILQVLREIDEDVEDVLLIGHNPGLSYLASTLSGDELPNDRAVAKDGALRTCRGAVLQYDGLWCDIDSQDCGVDRYLVPTVD